MAGQESFGSNIPEGYGNAHFADSTAAGRIINTGRSWSFSHFFLHVMNFLIGVACWLLGLNNRTRRGSDVSGTQNVLNAARHGEIQGMDATLNFGYGTGNPNLRATDATMNALRGITGTNNAFNADMGGKINLTGATVNAGAFAGNGIPQAKEARHIVHGIPAPNGSSVAS